MVEERVTLPQKIPLPPPDQSIKPGSTEKKPEVVQPTIKVTKKADGSYEHKPENLPPGWRYEIKVTEGMFSGKMAKLTVWRTNEERKEEKAVLFARPDEGNSDTFTFSFTPEELPWQLSPDETE